ncbi:MAG: NAD-dependent epimerase/dehydratase family protein [Candidatus Cryptobacteroides sp.]
MKVLITGAAGFIGSELLCRLAGQGVEVLGLDNINDYYDVELKYGRLERCGFHRPFIFKNPETSSIFPNARFVRMDLCDKPSMDVLFRDGKIDVVVNLAAQAGVRYSITNPYSYLQSNLEGFLNVLEGCRHNDVRHLVFASSSSVYGLNQKVPYSEEDKVDSPVSLYAATKKSDELMAYAYSRLYGFRCTGLRYFTVYGPWGRPDMAPMLFAEAISSGEPIKVFNNGDMLRDFTYIDDIVEGTMKVVLSGREGAADENGVPFRVYNIGASSPVRLMDFINELESALGLEARKVMMPMQPGDVYETYADTSRLEAEYGYRPETSLHDGIRKFVEWFRSDLNPLRH